MNVSLPSGAAMDNVESDQVKTFREFLTSFNKIAELCFTDCISDFTSRNVKEGEGRCAMNCIEKFLKVNQRISQRFQEFQMVANENAIAAAQKLGQNP